MHVFIFIRIVSVWLNVLVLLKHCCASCPSHHYQTSRFLLLHSHIWPDLWNLVEVCCICHSICIPRASIGLKFSQCWIWATTLHCEGTPFPKRNLHSWLGDVLIVCNSIWDQELSIFFFFLNGLNSKRTRLRLAHVDI